MSKRAAPVLAAATALVLAACGDDTATSDGLAVQTSFYPLQFISEQVAGDHASVVNLTQPGGEAHGLELSPRQVGEIADADLVVYLAGFQSAVDEAVAQNAADHAFDVAGTVTAAAEHDDHDDHDHADEDDEGDHADEDDDEGDHDGHDHDGDDHDDSARDPHVWLDPQNMIAMTEAVAERLAEVDAANADEYHANADALVDELAALDEEFEEGLARCERDLIVVSHEAYGYLADRYGLDQVGISGLDPESEPSPQRLAEVQDVVRTEGVTTVFYERLVSPAVATTMAEDLGIEAAVLDPIEGLSDDTADETYLTLMRQNLDALRTANDCS